MGLALRLVLAVCGLLCLLLQPVPIVDAAMSTNLFGDGTPNSRTILTAWADRYSYVRDDVSISYTGGGMEEALAAYGRQKLDFVGSDRALAANLLVEFGDLVQFPLFGQALVLAYNVDGLTSSDPNLVLSRETVGLIWAGEITMWNDTRIKTLNPTIASKLPAAPISLAYNINNAFSLAEGFKVAVSSFSSVFRTALAAANNSFDLMPPALAGRAVEAGESKNRTAWVLANPNSMTFALQSDGESAGLPWVAMYNRAGKLSLPSKYSVQAAMAEFSAAYSAGNLSVDISDAPGNDSWPLAFMTFILLNRSAMSLDCNNIEELIRFLAWTQVNDKAANLAIENGLVPIDVSLRQNLLDVFASIQCNNSPAIDTAFLIGAGPPLPIFTAWTTDQSTSDVTIKYFESTSQQAKSQLVSFDEEFGTTINGIEAEWTTAIPDIALLPAAVFGMVPNYNLAELDGLDLVLDFKTLADIYLGEITMWNDSRILALNSAATVAALPTRPIQVIVQTTSSSITESFTTLLNATVPAFAEQVGVTDVARFPVQALATTIAASNYSTLVSTLASTPDAFAVTLRSAVLLSRGLAAAHMFNKAGVLVHANSTSYASALRNYLAFTTAPAYGGVILTEGSASWPLAAFAALIYRSRTMQDCSKAAALADFFYYTQTSPKAKLSADRQGYIIGSTEPVLKSLFLNQLKAFTCNGVAVSSVAACINDGKLCSDIGSCANQACVCPSGRTGQYCEDFVSTDSSSDSATIGLAVGIPGAVFVVLVLACLVVVVVLILVKYTRNRTDDWEIEYSELDMGEQLGTGGYGAVHKAVWKGTEVAVKVMAAEKVTKEMEKSFQDEVRVMTSLRHPNVVLFMAASTKPPKMCIVMEFMSLGSLFELLHNELIPDIPFPLKAKMAYQASKGMHFLHSSGIVHRDLKSLNLLLDNKWNVKVSDFGLTKFREDARKGGAQANDAGSVHWTAPEVLNESADVDLILADVYSFGIILWELLTREQPYFGMSLAAVAVAVIRDNIRPRMPEVLTCPQEFEQLITSCWHSDPVIRPTFLEIMTRLSSMNGDSTSAGTSFTSRTSSSSSGGNSNREAKRVSLYGSSWTLPSTNGSASAGSGSSSSSGSKNGSAVAAQAAGGAVRAPEGELAIVFTDITRAASLWEFNPSAMRDATLLHNETLRAVLKRHKGYEVVFLRDRNSGEGSFCMAFQQASDALAWCCDVQRALLQVEWPEALLDHPGAAEEWGDTDDRVLYKGLRVRMGVHLGTPKVVRDPMTRRVEYIGPVVNAAARITAMTHGGQIVMSHAAHHKLLASAGPDAPLSLGARVVSLGKFEMPDVPNGARLYELKAEGLEARFFGGVTNDDGDGATTSSGAASDSQEVATRSSGGEDMQTAVGEGMMFKEDTFLTSANLCRWIIDFHEIQMGKQVGLGSYGVVYRGKWKGVEVAVKRFIKQKLDERRMLEFRAEMAFLSELHHPNIVLFIGACVKKPNLCIVTEFMKQGSLKDILANSAIKLTWKQKLRMLRSAALGINYLHSLQPVIVHRDLKPSNLLVDENWNVKVADFGFARIKEENATMTRCGTPCWTAPEIIRGEKYDERADVFSFGIIMWQALTRREPFAGRNFMGVSLDVLEGKRPQIPGDCTAEYRKMMKKCWHGVADKRPRMEDVVAFLDSQVGDDDVAPAGLAV